MKDTVTILGTRGSVSVSGAQFCHYGVQHQRLQTMEILQAKMRV